MPVGEIRREPGVAQIRRSLAAGLLLAAVVLPSAAHAQATLDKISFTRDVARTGHNDTGSTGEIRIDGSGITSATVVLPGATTPTVLAVEAATGDYVLGFTETTQALLDTAFPVGNYTLAVNTDEITGTIGYMPPAVTSPDITFPVHGSSRRRFRTSSRFSAAPSVRTPPRRG